MPQRVPASVGKSASQVVVHVDSKGEVARALFERHPNIVALVERMAGGHSADDVRRRAWALASEHFDEHEGRKRSPELVAREESEEAAAAVCARVLAQREAGGWWRPEEKSAELLQVVSDSSKTVKRIYFDPRAKSLPVGVVASAASRYAIIDVQISNPVGASPTAPFYEYDASGRLIARDVNGFPVK